ncbi:MAG: hypothetical protein ABR520_06120 [Mycobacteriales bacterium]|nr:hypothetical protein [Frankia sp.]
MRSQASVRRTLLAAVLLASSVITVSGVPASAAALGARSAATLGLAPAPVDRRPDRLAAAVAPMLRARAEAFRRHDVAAFMATVDPHDRGFERRQRASVENARALTFSAYTLTPQVSDVGDLSRPRDIRRFGPDTVVLDVRLGYGYAGGYDARPSLEDLFLTLTRDAGGTWRVAADDAVDDVGLRSARLPWDFARVRARASAHFLAVYPDNQAGEAGPVLSEAEVALRRVEAVWTPAWNRRTPIELPTNATALARRIQATFPLDNFVAFAYATVDRAPGSARFVGSRVLIQPATFLGNSAAYRREILSHELTHIASRPSAGPYLTSWLEEGLAQVLGENQSAVGLDPVNKLVRAGRWPGRFPRDFEFVVGGASRIYQSYAESYLAVREIEKLAGRGGVIRFYVAAGSGGTVSAGTATYHLDRASRAVLHIPLAELQRRYAADVRAGRLH